MLILTDYKEYESFDKSSFIDNLLKEQYPKFFSVLSKIQENINPIIHEPDAIVLVCIFQKICFEWDEIYRKEKWFLFPYLNHLNIENKKADNQKPFDYSKTNFEKLKTALIEFKLNLYVDKDMVTNTFDEIKTNIEIFEHNVIEIQKAKEEFLFSKYYASVI